MAVGEALAVVRTALRCGTQGPSARDSVWRAMGGPGPCAYGPLSTSLGGRQRGHLERGPTAEVGTVATADSVRRAPLEQRGPLDLPVPSPPAGIHCCQLRCRCQQWPGCRPRPFLAAQALPLLSGAGRTRSHPWAADSIRCPPRGVGRCLLQPPRRLRARLRRARQRRWRVRRGRLRREAPSQRASGSVWAPLPRARPPLRRAPREERQRSLRQPR